MDRWSDANKWMNEKTLKVNDVGKNATYADRADGFSDRAATSATATVQFRHIRGPCGIPGSEAADNASLKAITDKEASRKSTTPRQLISFGAFKHFINTTHTRFLSTTCSSGGGVSSESQLRRRLWSFQTKLTSVGSTPKWTLPKTCCASQHHRLVSWSTTPQT